MMRPLLLDLFCGAGGCSMGYHRAGFDVVGVDIKPQSRYPMMFKFIQADALEVLSRLKYRSVGGFSRECFAAIHASPPCQAYTPLKALQKGKEYADLLPDTRRLLMEIGLPWVIENVMSAPLGGVVLCGGMFGLRTYRHRRFESSEFIWQLPHPRHVAKTSTKKRRACWEAGMHISVTGDVGTYVGRLAMGIDWMNGNELSQAIPPAYTEYIGKQLIGVIHERAR